MFSLFLFSLGLYAYYQSMNRTLIPRHHLTDVIAIFIIILAGSAVDGGRLRPAHFSQVQSCNTEEEAINLCSYKSAGRKSDLLPGKLLPKITLVPSKMMTKIGETNNMNIEHSTKANGHIS